MAGTLDRTGSHLPIAQFAARRNSSDPRRDSQTTAKLPSVDQQASRSTGRRGGAISRRSARSTQASGAWRSAAARGRLRSLRGARGCAAYRRPFAPCGVRSTTAGRTADGRSDRDRPSYVSGLRTAVSACPVASGRRLQGLPGTGLSLVGSLSCDRIRPVSADEGCVPAACLP